MSDRLQTILKRKGPIKKIGVVGMGYVGIPSAALFADCPEFERVWGFQRDSPTSGYKIGMLNRGESPLKGEEPGLAELLFKVTSEGKFSCTSDFSRISDLDAVTLAIQTPFASPADLKPDFSSLIDALETTGRYLREGTLVVLESTVTPGTTEGFAREILESESGMQAGEDFALAHAPERVMVGRLLRNIREHDRIVGGIDPVSSAHASTLYRPVLTSGTILPMTARAAEVTKTAENTFRDLQIAAINQLALYCEALGVNVYDVRDGIASLKGEGITRAVLYPGAGVGGHCLTKDTYHLERGVRTLGEGADFPENAESLYLVARHVNDFMPEHMFRLIRTGLKRAGKDVRGSRIAMLGWAFIRNSDDARNPPSEVLRDLIIDAGGDVAVHDPFVERYPGVEISGDLEAVVREADAVVIMTGHDSYHSLRAGKLKTSMGSPRPVIVDGRNVVDPDEFIGAGFIYKGIGRGDKNRHPLAG